MSPQSPRSLRFSLIAVAIVVAATPSVPVAHAEQSPPPKAVGLRIVVIEGEAAVNIIQQKSAVAPIVEVRDRNNQPVAGAVVQFAITGGRATFGGARTLTVATNAAGQAAATGLTPTASGALQISASVAFQGQTAVAAIAQTNVMTAAEAAAVSAGAAGGGSSTAAGTGAASGGSGLSGTALGVIGGAVAGGALVAAKAATGNDGGTDNVASAPASPKSTTYSGAFTTQMLLTTTGAAGAAGTFTCVTAKNIVGNLTMTLQVQADGSVTGTANESGTQTDTLLGGPCQASTAGTLPFGASTWPVKGTPGNLEGSRVDPFTGGAPVFFVGANTIAFSGALNAGVVSGTLTISKTAVGQGPVNEGGTATVPVTLR